MSSAPPITKKEIEIHALFLGERLDLKTFQPKLPAPLPAAAVWGTSGRAVFFRYGAVVLFDVAAEEEAALLLDLEGRLSGKYEKPESERVRAVIDPERREGAEANAISIQDGSTERLQVVASILAKSVVLAHYEERVAKVFDEIEPLAAHLQQTGRAGRSSDDLLHQIGRALLIQHTMVGRVEIIDKPEVLWLHPTLEVLYARLEDEYELIERHHALERKLKLISDTAETVLAILRTERSLHVEWYIVLLIVVEIIITVYSTFLAE